jgi:hypothetical protein
MRCGFVLSVALLFGCGDREAARLGEIKTVVCACKTVSCAEIALKSVPKDQIKSTHRAQMIARDMLDCLSKLYDAERPSTDPDAATGPETPAAASAGTP